MTEIKPSELCDACGQAVDPADAYKGELAVGDLMCPAPMTFHQSCYEKASELWQPDPDSTCIRDDLFPETQQWTNPPETGQA